MHLFLCYHKFPICTVLGGNLQVSNFRALCFLVKSETLWMVLKLNCLFFCLFFPLKLRIWTHLRLWPSTLHLKQSVYSLVGFRWFLVSKILEYFKHWIYYKLEKFSWLVKNQIGSQIIGQREVIEKKLIFIDTSTLE